MNSMDSSIIQAIVIGALPIILAITVHEASHAYAAKRFGDSTAYVVGRMTLNPLKHIDPFGTILLPIVCMVLGGFLFGWAKPVPVNFGALRNPKRDMIWVAAAGPASNLVMALLWAVLFKLSHYIGGDFADPLSVMSSMGIMINVSLMVLNLLPLPPLDGGRIVEGLLPRGIAYKYSQIEPYGMWILVALMVTGLLRTILWPLASLAYGIINAFMQLF